MHIGFLKMRAFRHRSLFTAIALLSAASTLSPQATASSEALYTQSHPAMGTVFTIQCYMPDPDSADRIMTAAFEEIDRVEALLSNYQPSSELSRISREAGDRPVVTDPET